MVDEWGALELHDAERGVHWSFVAFLGNPGGWGKNSVGGIIDVLCPTDVREEPRSYYDSFSDENFASWMFPD